MPIREHENWIPLAVAARRGHCRRCALNSPPAIASLEAAIAFGQELLARHPERDALAAYSAAAAGRRRRYPALYLGHLYVPGDAGGPADEITLPAVTAPDTAEGALAREIVGMFGPLGMLNPVNACFGMGAGTAALVPCFGIPLDPSVANGPAFTRSLAEVLADPPPDPETAGPIPEWRRRIDLLRDRTPAAFKIGLPDMQGPFNLAHAILGNDALLAPYDSEKDFHAFMERLTSFWIALRRQLMTWIGEERLNPRDRMGRIAECSVNLVSPDFYEQFILPHDRRIAEAFGPLHIHPCSGPHVFRATLKNLPVAHTEAGFVDRAAAGAIAVADALAAIGGRPVLLSIGQELPEGREYEFIREDFDRYKTNPRLLFSYTGMHWRRRDRGMIRDMHRRLDEHWAEKC